MASTFVKIFKVPALLYPQLLKLCIVFFLFFLYAPSVEHILLALTSNPYWIASFVVFDWSDLLWRSICLSDVFFQMAWSKLSTTKKRWYERLAKLTVAAAAAAASGCRYNKQAVIVVDLMDTQAVVGEYSIIELCIHVAIWWFQYVLHSTLHVHKIKIYFYVWIFQLYFASFLELI